jgi:hypothetical protein
VITTKIKFMRRPSLWSLSTLSLLCALAGVPASADSFAFSTGNPDGLIGTLSRVDSGGGIQTETADDFVLSEKTKITSATFTGLIPSQTALSSISRVEIEFYHVFPGDSANPPSNNVPTRANSPGDVEIASATRDSAAGDLHYTSTLLSGNFSVANSVVDGIHPKPGQLTLGEGPVTGEEVMINVTFDTPVTLDADHYFFRPEALLTDGNFLLLSAPRPILPPGIPFGGDLQSWIRNDNLSPDWLRIGTDITGQGPFNASFSLAGDSAPEPGSMALLGVGLGTLLFGARQFRRKALGERGHKRSEAESGTVAGQSS